MYSISNNYTLDITINGKNAGIDFSAPLKSLRIYENVLDITQAELEITIPADFNDSYPIVDGSAITFDIKYSGGKNESYYNKPLNFRVFDFESSEIGSASMLNFKILLVHESYYKLTARANGIYYATVSNLFKTKAKELNLDTDRIITTNDAQSWIHSGSTLKEFLDNACLHSYRDSKSVMIWSVSRYGSLLLNDLTDIMGDDIAWFLIPPVSSNESLSNNQIVYTTPRYKCDSGLNNVFQGYGKVISWYNTIQNKSLTDNVREFYKGSNKININKDCSVNQRFEDVGIDSGNLHSNYFRALIQNQRGRSLYSTHIQFRIDNPRDVRLADTVSYFMNVDKDKQNKCYTGTYFVSRITTEITPSKFINYIEITNQGINTISTELY